MSRPTTTQPPSEDERRRSDKAGRFWCQCHYCKHWFLWRDKDVKVCGVLLPQPEARCLVCDDFGNWRWPRGKEMPDLRKIQAFWDRAEAEGDDWRRVPTAD